MRRTSSSCRLPPRSLCKRYFGTKGKVTPTNTNGGSDQAPDGSPDTTSGSGESVGGEGHTEQPSDGESVGGDDSVGGSGEYAGWPTELKTTEDLQKVAGDEPLNGLCSWDEIKSNEGSAEYEYQVEEINRVYQRLRNEHVSKSEIKTQIHSRVEAVEYWD